MRERDDEMYGGMLNRSVWQWLYSWPFSSIYDELRLHKGQLKQKKWIRLTLCHSPPPFLLSFPTSSHPNLYSDPISRPSRVRYLGLVQDWPFSFLSLPHSHPQNPLWFMSI